MIYKLVIGSLAICTLAACGDNNGPIVQSDDKPISGGIVNDYICFDKTKSESLVDIRPKLTITAKKSEPKMPRLHFNGDALYQADVKYYTVQPDSDNAGSFVMQNIFKYTNVEFEYDSKDLILKIPNNDNLPACQIRFKNDGKIGEHKCEFEKSDVGYRAATFNISCQRDGKIGTFTEPEL